MYTQTDYEKTKKQVILRSALFLLILGITITGCALCMKQRIHWCNLLCAGVGGFIAAFWFSLYCLPWYFYQRHLNDIKKGRSHEYDVTFLSFSDQTSLRDGISVHDVVVTLGDDLQKEEDQRLFFWDDDKARPSIKPGDAVHIRAFGNYIIAWDVR